MTDRGWTYGPSYQPLNVFREVESITSQDHTLEVRVQSWIVTSILGLLEVLYKPFHIIHHINKVKSSAQLKLFTKSNMVFKISFIYKKQEILNLDLIILRHKYTWDMTHTSKYEYRNIQSIRILQMENIKDIYAVESSEDIL